MVRSHNRTKAAREAAKKAPNEEPDSALPDLYTRPIDLDKLAEGFAEKPTIGAWMTLMQRRIAGLKDPLPYEHDIDCHYIGCIDRTYHTLERLVECVVLSGRPVLDAIRCWNGHVPEKYQVPLAAFQEPAVPIAPLAAKKAAYGREHSSPYAKEAPDP